MNLYIDPGTGSMLFTILIGVIGAAFYSLRMLLIKLRFRLSGGKTQVSAETYPIVIFSDDKRYWNVFRPICEELDRRGMDVVYMTASQDDPALSCPYSHVRAQFIGSGNSAFAKLNFLNATILLSTTPGLDVYQWKRAKDPRFYVHIAHAPNDITLYRMFGLDYYDAVLLSGFAKVRKGEHVLDLGTGTGIIPILLEAKTKGAHFTGLEIQPESAEMARRSVIYNHLEEKVSIVEADIKDASSIFGNSSMDVITTNPPYMIAEHGLQNDGDAKTIARHEVLCNLDDILRESARILRPNGRFYMVHRPFRLAEIFSKMINYRIEPKRMRLVHPYVDKEPNMVLIEGYRDGKSRLTVEKPLVVYKSPNVYTDEILEIYGKKD